MLEVTACNCRAKCHQNLSPTTVRALRTNTSIMIKAQAATRAIAITSEELNFSCHTPHSNTIRLFVLLYILDETGVAVSMTSSVP